MHRDLAFSHNPLTSQDITQIAAFKMTTTFRAKSWLFTDDLNEQFKFSMEFTGARGIIALKLKRRSSGGTCVSSK